MTGQEINLQQMLTRREQRVNEQNFFLKEYHSPLISFSMNIPGPIKTNEKIRKAFDSGRLEIFEALENLNAQINIFKEVHEVTGDELLISVKNLSAETLKDMAIKIENDSKLGRLFDIDVIDSQGHKLSRKIFRKCLICDRQAQECARARTHSIEEMQKAIEELIYNL